MTTEFELAHRVALQHVGAVALLASEPNEAVRELAAAIQAVEEFWHRAEASADEPETFREPSQVMRL
jgi:hypothetical protein